MTSEKLIFVKKGFPSIKIFESHFEIKAIDYWEYRKFNYSEVKNIKHYNPNNIWYMKLYILSSLAAQIFSDTDSWILKISKINGGNWKYRTSYSNSFDFNEIINLISKKCQTTS